ncbi:MAG: nickel-type superoxide dismutase maturation protease [Actinobacteria bacterium]|nr:nickel-type superoxide dismutase maturation protease [Actinomycetota bacterium]
MSKRLARTGASLSILAGVAAALSLGLRRVEVYGESMEPSLYEGDRLLVAKIKPRVGDVLVVRDPRALDRLIIKRLSSLDEDRLYVLGDRPDRSTDSREFGALPASLLVGKMLFRYSRRAR